MSVANNNISTEIARMKYLSKMNQAADEIDGLVYNACDEASTVKVSPFSISLFKSVKRTARRLEKAGYDCPGIDTDAEEISSICWQIIALSKLVYKSTDALDLAALELPFRALTEQLRDAAERLSHQDPATGTEVDESRASRSDSLDQVAQMESLMERLGDGSESEMDGGVRSVYGIVGVKAEKLANLLGSSVPEEGFNDVVAAALVCWQIVALTVMLGYVPDGEYDRRSVEVIILDLIQTVRTSIEGRPE